MNDRTRRIDPGRHLKNRKATFDRTIPIREFRQEAGAERQKQQVKKTGLEKKFL